jgi:hypothetical protein
VHRDLRDQLVQFRTHMAKALEHMSRLGQRRPKPGDDDYPEADDANANDPDDDNELAASIARLKRLKACEDLRIAGERSFVAVPEAFKVLNTARQVQAIISHISPSDKGLSYLPRGMDYQDYLAKSGAVLWEHGDRPIAWCIHIDVYNDRVEATGQFPPEGVSALADEIFRQINEGVATGASTGAAWLDTTPKGDIVEITEWELNEWSFCRTPVQPLARIISIGGAPAQRAWDDPRQPRRPEYLEAGGTGTHYVAALRRYEMLKRAAPWVN